MVASADGLQGALDNDLEAATNTSLLQGAPDDLLQGGGLGAGGRLSDLTSSSTLDPALHINVTTHVTDVPTTDVTNLVVTSPADVMAGSLPPGGGVGVDVSLYPSSPSPTFGKAQTEPVRATAAHPYTAPPALTTRSAPLIVSASPSPEAPSDPPHIADKSPSPHLQSNITITENTTIAAAAVPTILPADLSHQIDHQQNQTQINNQDLDKIKATSSQEMSRSGPHMSGGDDTGTAGPAAPVGRQRQGHHQERTTPPPPVSHLIIGATFLPTHPTPAATPVGDSKTNVHSPGVLKNATGKSRTPSPNKTDVVTLARSGEPEPGGSSPLPVAAVVVPVICVLLLLVIGLVVFLHKRRAHTHSYKRRTHRDEESSTDVTSSLMGPDLNGNDNQPTSEPVYAIVDKSKKRRVTESLSGGDESVSLTHIEDPVYTANGTCTSPGDDSHSVTEDVPSTSIVPGGHEEPLYDVPPLEEAGEDQNTSSDERTAPQVPAHVPQVPAHVPQVPAHVPQVPAHVPHVPVHVPHVPARGAAGGPAQGGSEDLTLVECDVYEAADHYDPSRDDEDGTYEIPDSPATVRARRSVARISGLLQGRGYLPADTATHPLLSPSTPPETRHSLSPTFGDESLSIPHRVDEGNTSDSSSGLDSDFEDLWPLAGTGPNVTEGACGPHVHTPETANKTEDEGEVVRTPPPVPRLPPESEGDSDYYLSPMCHTHCPPGPDWKPFHEYDPVYVPHSDPSAMAARVDSQNYVRGRQRSDSRNNPYEEIQFGAIYDTVDDDDDVFQPGQHPRNPIQVPPRVPIPPSPPPPLVPRRVRPISGVADVGPRPRSINKPLPDKPLPDKPLPDKPLPDKPLPDKPLPDKPLPDKPLPDKPLPDKPLPDKPLPDKPLPDKPLPDTPQAGPELLPGVVLVQQEPRYSGLILEDVPHLQEELQQHDYTPLEYTKLHSVGSGPLLGDDDIKAMDETDSETYSKETFTRLQGDQKEEGADLQSGQQQGQQQHDTEQQGHKGQQQGQGEQQKPPLPPRLISTKNNNSTGEKTVTNKATSGSADYKSGLVFKNGDVINGDQGEPYSESSSDSDDSYESYEPFDFSPPETPSSK